MSNPHPTVKDLRNHRDDTKRVCNRCGYEVNTTARKKCFIFECDGRFVRPEEIDPNLPKPGTIANLVYRLNELQAHATEEDIKYGRVIPKAHILKRKRRHKITQLTVPDEEK